jgi:hypothetical protein
MGIGYKAILGTHFTMHLKYLTLKKRGKRENLMETPHLRYNALKIKKERKTTTKKLCPSLQGDLTIVQVYAR